MHLRSLPDSTGILVPLKRTNSHRIHVVYTALLGTLLSLLIVSVPVYPVNEVTGWAVIIEMNDFPEGYGDINISFLNTKRLVDALIELGWSDDQIHRWNEPVTRENLSTMLNWLDDRAERDDIALLYIFTHGSWISKVLSWNEWVPDRLDGMKARSKMIIVDSCNSGAFISPFTDSSRGGVYLSACSAGQVSWAGLEEEGLPILGSVWTYYFVNALTSPIADVNSDGWVSVEEAFNSSVPLTHSYMMDEVFTVPEFLQMYHDIGVYPAKEGNYPNPFIVDKHPGQLVLDLSFYVSEELLPIFALLLLLYGIRKVNYKLMLPVTIASDALI